MNRYKSLADTLGMKFVGHSPNPLTTQESDIARVEDKIGHPLPSDYREFVRDYGKFTPERGSFFSMRFEGREEETGGFDVFYCAYPDRAYGLLENYHTYHEWEQRMPPEMLPIAEVGSGSQICLAISGRHTGSVYFWDHYQGEGPSNYSNIAFIASSFDDFMHLLRNEE